jgi:hypothetical protein
MAVLLEEVLNVQLIQELQQQRNKLDCRREGRLLNPMGPVVYKGPPVQSPTINQTTAQGLALGYSLVSGYEDW